MKPTIPTAHVLDMKPADGDEAYVESLPLIPATLETGHKVLISEWELTDEERELIAKGHKVCLTVFHIGALPPMTLNVAEGAVSAMVQMGAIPLLDQDGVQR